MKIICLPKSDVFLVQTKGFNVPPYSVIMDVKKFLTSSAEIKQHCIELSMHVVYAIMAKHAIVANIAT